MRKGLGKGKGKGYKNIQGRDPKIHSDSARGRKQPQRMPNLSKLENEYKVLLNNDIRDFSQGLENIKTKKRMDEIEKTFKDSEKRLKFIKEQSPKRFTKAMEEQAIDNEEKDSIFQGETDLGKINEKFNDSDLRQFSGGDNYYSWSILFPRFKLTDGTKYLSEKAQAYWLMDIVGSYQSSPKFRGEEFQVWKLKKGKGKEAIVTADDGNDNILRTQKIPYTDFFDKYDGDEIKLYFTNGIILLPSEY